MAALLGRHVGSALVRRDVRARASSWRKITALVRPRRPHDGPLVLAFSARASPADCTHPVADDLTGRWLDALAHGGAVAGGRPRSTTADLLLRGGATLELPVNDVDEGRVVVATASRAWTPTPARENRRVALRAPDWRWRGAEVFSQLRVNSPQPNADLDLLSSTARKMV